MRGGAEKYRPGHIYLADCLRNRSDCNESSCLHPMTSLALESKNRLVFKYLNILLHKNVHTKTLLAEEASEVYLNDVVSSTIY